METKGRKIKNRRFRYIFIALFVVYSIFLFSILILKWLPFYNRPQWQPLPLSDQSPINTEFFTSIKKDIRVLQEHGYIRSSFFNLFGNILAFIPCGLLLSLIYRGAFIYLRTFLTGLAITLTVELIQLITSFGIWDIDDIFLNMCGLLIGMLLSLPYYFTVGQNKTRSGGLKR